MSYQSRLKTSLKEVFFIFQDLSIEVDWRSFAHKDGVYSVDLNKVYAEAEFGKINVIRILEKPN